MAELGEAQRREWLDLRSSNPVLDSPYFHPGYAESFDRVSGRVEVGIFRAGGTRRVVGFLPFQRHDGVLRPAGWPATDLQAVVAAPGFRLPTVQLLRAAGASTLAFDGLLAGTAEYYGESHSMGESPHAEISGGWGPYLERLDPSGRRKMASVSRIFRKVIRESAAVHFCIDDRDHATLDRLIELKRHNIAARDGIDYFRGLWSRKFVHHLLDVREGSFSGLLSSLRIDGELAAAHFGIVSDGVLHWWFPVYDSRFARLGPGWLLLQQLATHGRELGLRRVDLGPGDESYKLRARTGATELRTLTVSTNTYRQSTFLARQRIRGALKRSPVVRRALRAADHLRAPVADARRRSAE